MIKNWDYVGLESKQDEIKKHIKDNNYKTIDVGASARYWSYPECKIVADAYPINKEDVLFFDLNIEDKNSWDKILQYVEENGKFDFSICSHTLEDVFNPIEFAVMLEKVSHRGYIAIPSKYNEFTKLYSNLYRGDAHHKQFFDVVDDMLVIYPKFSWIETDERSDKILENRLGNELIVMWEETIPMRVFANGKPFLGDDSLINAYYNELLVNRK
jgi:hypothetical protein